EADRLRASSRHLEALSPRHVLRRGYAVVRDGDGRVVRDASVLAAGQALDVELASGRVGARVEEVRP
ncbi:MAG: exodeoxyribonuclease VII large subunit, partial [Acidimicrobiales bacterium]